MFGFNIYKETEKSPKFCNENEIGQEFLFGIVGDSTEKPQV